MRHLLALVILAAIPPARAADTLYLNASIHTADDARPRAEAMLVRDGLVAAIGPRAEVEAAAAPDAERIDLAARAVLPGLIDAHGHMQGLGAFGLGRLDLSRARSFSDLIGAVRERAAAAEPGQWILGGRWDHESWTEKLLPTHAPLSAVSPDHPVWLRRVDGHAALANAAAMRKAGITRATPSPPGGEIIRDAQGNPTGVFIDNAMRLFDDALPAQPETTADLLLKAQEMCLAAGLTSVHDMGLSPREIAEYRRLESDGRLTIRVNALVSSFYALRYFEENPVYTGPRLTVRATKVYIDGAMGSRGAWLLQPYADRPTGDDGAPYAGLAVSDPAFIEELARHAIEKGYQVAAHAIGDRGNREVLDAYQRAGVRPEHRFRIEHAQLLSPDDIPRFASLGVIASMQPTHCTSDMRWVDARVGPERARGAYAWASLLRAGARLAGGSDFPVESHNPFLGLHAAVTRQTTAGEPPGGWHPQERLSRDQALRLFTRDAAFAAFMEDRIGTLAPRMQADFIVLDRDPLAADPADIPRTRVLRTVIAGRTVATHPAPAP